MLRCTLPLLLLFAFACSSGTEPNWRPSDSDDYLLRAFSYRFAYCGAPEIRALTQTKDSYVALIIQPVNHRNGMYFLDAYWAAVMAAGDTAWMFLGMQTGSYWGADTSEVMFWPESSNLVAGNWLLPLLTWTRVDGNLHGNFQSRCDDGGAWYYADIAAVFEYIPRGNEARAQYDIRCDEQGACGGVRQNAGDGDTPPREWMAHEKVREDARREFEREMVSRYGPPPEE